MLSSYSFGAVFIFYSSGLSVWQEKMITSYHIFDALKYTTHTHLQKLNPIYGISGPMATQQINKNGQKGHFDNISVSGVNLPQDAPQGFFLDRALLEGVRSGSVGVLRTFLQYAQVPVPVQCELSAVEREKEKEREEEIKVCGMGEVIKFNFNLRSLLIAAAARGSLPLVQMLIEYYKKNCKKNTVSAGDRGSGEVVDESSSLSSNCPV